MTMPSLEFRRSALTWLLYGMLGWYAYGQAAITPLMPLLRRDLGLSFTISSLHPAAFALGMISAGLLGDRAAQQLGMRGVFWGGTFGMTLGMLLLTVGTAASMTITAAYLMGLAGTLAMISIQTSLVVLHGRSSPIALTESNIVASFTAAVVPLAVGVFEGSGQWRGALLIAPLVWAALFVWQGRAALPSRPSVKRSASGSLPIVVWLYLAAIFAAGGVEWGAWLFAADYLIVTMGLDAASAASMIALFPLGALSGRILLSRLLHRRTPQSLLPYTMLIVCVGFPLFYMSSPLIVKGAGLFLMGVGGSGFFPLAVAAVTSAAGPHFGRASAYVPLASGAAILINPPLLGSVADAVGLSTAYVIVPTLALLTLGVVVLANAQHSRAQQDN